MGWQLVSSVELVRKWGAWSFPPSSNQLQTQSVLDSCRSYRIAWLRDEHSVGGLSIRHRWDSMTFTFGVLKLCWYDRLKTFALLLLFFSGETFGMVYRQFPMNLRDILKNI